MKTHIRPLLTGILVLAVIALIMLKITVDFQILFWIGSAIFFAAGYVNANTKNHYLVTTAEITVFFFALFTLTALKQLPSLWYFLPVYFIWTLSGVLFNFRRKHISLLATLLSVAMLFVTFSVIPDDLKKSLTKERFDPLPPISIQKLSEEIIDSKTLKGKVVVIDFFGTWCKPCRLELKELEKIRQQFAQEDVVFYIINSDQSGDTPEKFKKFIAVNNYPFNYAYDFESKLFKQLGLYQYGLPTLLVIDKDQNIRLQHIGYNSAETDFTKDLIDLIQNLL